ncbi:hypothetical protein GRX03_11805 [Halovenus sp. WSH3]|uniref:Uncharacterized protein n=1 Tax=Halovenus carboxidivorans TaxID=2692199 RepID=A0A6B0T2J0_9EURY|nr:hypothetical protein [Halovenus carboxidivorans]MXR52284.1 hypothetical protein [Halovenus carboxidivorans]
MPNPWTFDEDEIPEDPRKRRRRRRMRLVGAFFWGLFVAGVTVLLAADTGGLTRTETLSLVALSLGTALVAVGLGVVLLVLLGTFSILGKAVIGLVGLGVFFVALPAGVSFVLDNVSLFEGVGTGAEQPFVDLVRSLLG